MSRRPGAFHSEMRHYAEVKHTLNFRFTAPLKYLKHEVVLIMQNA